jgi:tetratricopeptide (TPR) repeat protein
VAADSKAKLLQDAEKYVLQGRLQQAIGEYLKVIKSDPKDVLILNTIGDLYLRQKNSHEANKYFSQVAETYVQNNFFLKAIAVYKKILNADPNNLEINSTMASLFAKQGLSIDACNQYLRVAALLEKDGKTKESLDAYEKIVEIDPANSAIQRKLAEMHLVGGAEERAHDHWAGAARAQVRAGDLEGAADSFKRAMRLAPIDVDTMRGFLGCCMEMENLGPALDQLKKSVDMAPENLDIREMLGQAHMANGDPEAAAKAFQVVVSLDESRYENFFPVIQELIERDSCDRALGILDTIIPILITRRKTERAVECYELILHHHPKHVLTLTKLASIYSATGDQPRHVRILDQIADYYLSEKRPAEAIEYLEKIIKADPESDKHRKLHHQAFAEAYPDVPYVPPTEPEESPTEAISVHIQGDSQASDEGSHADIVEVDLLLNYGLRDKALSLLRTLEARDPNDREVRARLLNIFKAEKKHTEAAEQCLLLAVLHRRAKNEASAQSYLAEAKQLDPNIAEYEADLEAFARQNGILAEAATSGSSAASVFHPDDEVDLSGDLLDVFFNGSEESVVEEASKPQEIHEAIAEEYPQEISTHTAPKTMEEQLQEVDFYIRLGFNDEALTKLDELARISPDNPELVLRYKKLNGEVQTDAQAPSKSDRSRQPDPKTRKTMRPDDLGDLQLLETDDDQVSAKDDQHEALKIGQHPASAQNSVSAENDFADRISKRPRSQNVVPFGSGKSDFKVNEMFADLMEEVGASTQKTARASFEEHFSLGTAYRDMDLIEEAIKEFQNALKSIDIQKGDAKVIQCCGMLSTCFLKKNMPRSALRWCQAGLKISDISSHEAMALRYDMGIAHSMAGESEQALECFDHIFSLDPGYRDVAQRIDDLKGGFERHAPYP